MKTIQETLREMDKNEVVDTFLRNHPSQLKEFDDGLTIGEAKTVDEIIIFVDRKFDEAPVKRVELRRKAQDLYPAGYN